MGDDYENVEWDVHAPADAFTPQIDRDDPLSVYNPDIEDNFMNDNHRHSQFYAHQPNQSASLLPSSASIESFEYPTSQPIKPPSPPQNDVPELNDDEEPLVAQTMTIRISDAQRHSEGTQGAYVSYLITTTRNDKQMQSRQVPPPASVLESLSDTLLNAFAKVKKPDERFLSMKDCIDKFEDNLGTVERLYARISKRQYDLQQDYASFANSIHGLSALETNITHPLLQFADTTKLYVEAMKEMTNNEELLFLNDVHELLAYCHAAKAVLRTRDQKQVDFEALSAYLQQAIHERDRMRHPGRSFHNRGSVNFTEFMTDRINEVRGVDIESARRDKITRLDRKIKSLQDEVARANDVSNRFSDQLVQEFEIFQRAKTKELKQGLAAYADCHIEFFQQGASIWEKILPALESLKVDDEDDRDTEDE
ncbi:intercellular trafficking and secretion [Apophysomyces sp. BC1034]|nr:intercellular trafficking and secretion [Apophysomyces sp. BC1015]KAG0181337.1 intercellular trafficking and secretion [Apophysomyces sp. BC1021]KAG0191860.1 intercellular trafficking and secretion [Apophysomyces sp. BC1034]